MADRGAKYADKALSRIDRELQATYKTASRELARKLADFKKKFAVKDREKRKQRDNGEITDAEYKDWLGGQVFMRKQWEQKIEQVNQVMLHHNEQAVKIINESSFDVFAENYYAEAFKAQWICVDISFNVYNTQAIARLIKENPKLLPEWKIDEEKDYTWNYKKVNNIVKQGIIQGEGIDQITERLCRELSTLNDKKMRMFARTAVTGAQSAGRQLQMDEAAKLDIEQEKEWLATHDGATRDSHRKMDGVRVPYDKHFPNGLMYPGDPEGDPGEVYNCRCTTTTIYPKYENRQKDWREDETINGVPYEVWKEGKKAAKEYKKNQQNESSGDGNGNEPKTYDEYNAEIAKLKVTLDNWDDSKYKSYAESATEYTKVQDRYEELRDKRLTVPYPDDDIMGEYNKTKHTSLRETERDTNPLFKPNTEYSKNCSNCVVANEMRARGYDVIAGVADKKIRMNYWDGKGNIVSGKGSWTDCFKDMKREVIGAKRKEQQIPLIEGLVKNWGIGSRGVVYVQWDTGNGHYFSVANVNGEIRFSNPQNNNVDANGFFEYSKPSKTAIFRLDNLKPTEYIKKVVRKNEK